MSNYKISGMELAYEIFSALEFYFAGEAFLNATEMKQWLGDNIKNGGIGGYRNLTYNNYKAVFDVIKDSQTYHVGIDFGQQVVHVTLEPGNVYSLYYRTPFAS